MGPMVLVPRHPCLPAFSRHAMILGSQDTSLDRRSNRSEIVRELVDRALEMP